MARPWSARCRTPVPKLLATKLTENTLFTQDEQKQIAAQLRGLAKHVNDASPLSEAQKQRAKGLSLLQRAATLARIVPQNLAPP
jgi:hypothetical protein